MSKLKHYKGDGWEVKVKYDEETGMILWKIPKGRIPDVDVNDSIRWVINAINKVNNIYSVITDVKYYNKLINHLDNLTAPTIINEHTFDNDNFKIRIWETEDKIGGETLWVREGFEYNDKIQTNRIVIKWNTSTDFGYYELLPDFGRDEVSDEANKSKINYTYTDLYKALERAEQETSELTYDTVVKELDGLEGEELYEAMNKYQYQYTGVNPTWDTLSYVDDFFDIPTAFKRGLIKLRRVK